MDCVIPELKKLNIETYKKGGIVNTIDFFSTSIHIFETLAECLITIDNNSIWTNKFDSYYSLKHFDEVDCKPCKICFNVRVDKAEGFKILFGEDVSLPKILQNYQQYRNNDGNSLLDATDMVSRVSLPFEYDQKEYYNFEFSFAMSKSGLNKRLKELGLSRKIQK